MSSQIIREARVHFKSTPVNYLKEEKGLKRNTVRKDPKDSRAEVLTAFMRNKVETLYITISNTESGEFFERKVTDVTTIDDYYIISW